MKKPESSYSTEGKEAFDNIYDNAEIGSFVNIKRSDGSTISGTLTRKGGNALTGKYLEIEVSVHLPGWGTEPREEKRVVYRSDC